MSRALFIIKELESGKTYRIFTDGRIEGFPAECLIFNRYPSFLASALCQSKAASITSGVKSSHDGGEHGSGPKGASTAPAISTVLGEK